MHRDIGGAVVVGIHELKKIFSFFFADFFRLPIYKIKIV